VRNKREREIIGIRDRSVHKRKKWNDPIQEKIMEKEIRETRESTREKI
jgi:hypothetical protein